MNCICTHALTLVLLLTSASAFAQQPDPLTQLEVKGHVYEPQAIAPTDQRIAHLALPDGFHIHRFAEGLDNPRMLAVASDGSVYVTQRRPGTLVLLRDLDGDGIVDIQRTVAHIRQLHGIEIRDRRIYLATVKRVYAADLRPDGTLGPLEILASGLPDGGQHPNRTLRFGTDGKLYVSVGSTCNACGETNSENATLLRMDPITGKREIFASGLRNTIGFDWHPVSGRLYGMDQGIDWLGDEEQTEELNEIVEGTRYGWPYVYDDDQLNPQDEPEHSTQLQWADLSASPVGGYTAHAASMQMRFYDGAAFPGAYRNSAFVAMHGSWNRKPASGYEVVRAMFSSAGDFVGFEPFVTGFLQPQPNTTPPLPGAQPLPLDGYVGRPTGIAVAKDGALLVGDDSNNVIYRVVYGAAPRVTAQKLSLDILDARSDKSIRIRSSAFAANGPIPVKYSDYGKGSSPPLEWGQLPAGTKSFLLMMEDPDATSPLPFVHWIAIGSPDSTGLREDIAKFYWPQGVNNLEQGSNSRSAAGYFGPRPPPGSGTHRYHFQIFALDTALRLGPGANRHAVLEAANGHVLAEGVLVGTFRKAP
jgi:Raf kinase inhibitor-like YbhB/YbcL family protein